MNNIILENSLELLACVKIGLILLIEYSNKPDRKLWTNISVDIEIAGTVAFNLVLKPIITLKEGQQKNR